MSDYYNVLGVARDAPEKEIRQAYRRLARQYHPDVNKSDAAAEEKFKEINEAYSVLSDADSRKKYDRYGENWRHADDYEKASAHGRAGGGGFRWQTTVDGADFGDLFAGRGGGHFQDFGGGRGFRFDDLFRADRGSARRPPPEYPVEVTLDEAFRGATRTLRAGDGRTLEVKIPPGVDQGSRVHIGSGAEQGGDFYLVVSVLEHDRFRREGRDLYVEVDLPVDDAVLGAEIPAPTLSGQVALTVPPNTPNERRFRLSGQGMPSLGNSTAGVPGNKNAGRGDLYVTVKTRLPAEPSAAEIELFRQLREIRTGRFAADGSPGQPGRAASE